MVEPPPADVDEHEAVLTDECVVGTIAGDEVVGGELADHEVVGQDVGQGGDLQRRADVDRRHPQPPGRLDDRRLGELPDDAVNRHLYVGTNCFGLWRFPPPNTTEDR